MYMKANVRTKNDTMGCAFIHSIDFLLLAGVDSVWEQRKLEARKMLENGAESPASRARGVRRLL
jgi:hypothetical protein